MSEIIDDTGPDALTTKAKAILKIMNLTAPGAVAAAKQLAFHVSENPNDDAMTRHTAAELARLRLTDENKSGIVALLSKQPPPWAKVPLVYPE